MLRVPRFNHPDSRGWVLMIEGMGLIPFHIYIYVCIYVANSRLLMIALCPVFDGSLNVNHHF